MLLVKTKLLQTLNKGIGLFADENIPKNTIVHIEDPLFNKTYSKEDVAKFTPLQKEFCHKYMTHNQDGTMSLDLDNTRFLNHSKNPNIKIVGKAIIASRDIEKGEELLIDYTTFDHQYRNGVDFKEE